MLIWIIKICLTAFQIFIAISFGSLAVILFKEQVVDGFWNPDLRFPWWGATLMSLAFFAAAYFISTQ